MKCFKITKKIVKGLIVGVLVVTSFQLPVSATSSSPLNSLEIAGEEAKANGEASPANNSENKQSEGAILNANNFSITLTDAPNMTKEIAIEKAGANVEGIDSIIDLQEQELQELQSRKVTGTYPLTFMSEGLTKSILVSVEENLPNNVRKAEEAGKLKVDIPNYNASNGWKAEDAYEMIIEVEFDVNNNEEKKVEITIPEGMRFVSIPVKDNVGGINVPVDSALRLFIKDVVVPKDNKYYQSSNGKLTYHFIETASKIKIEGIKITPDGKLYYGQKTFAEGVHVQAFEGAVNVGNIKEEVKATGEATIAQMSVKKWENELSVPSQSTAMLTPGSLTIKPQRNIAEQRIYMKEIETFIDYPKGLKIVDTAPTKIEDNTEKAYLHLRKSNVLVDYNNIYSDFKIEYSFTVESLLPGKYSTLGKVKSIVTMYDGKIFELENQAGKLDVNVTEPVKSENIFPMDVKNASVDMTTDDVVVTEPEMSFDTKGKASITSQVLEYRMDENYEAHEVSFPSRGAKGAIEKIEYITTFGKTGTAEGKQIKELSAVNGLSGYAISKESLALEEGEYISSAKAQIGNFPSGSRSTNTQHVNLRRMYVLGRLKNGVDESKIIVNSWANTTDDIDSREMGSENTKVSTIKRATIRSVYLSKIADQKVIAGETKRMTGVLTVYSYNYTNNHTIIDPTIYIRIPEGTSINPKKIEVTQGDEIIPTVIDGPYVTSAGENVISIKTEAKIGMFFENGRSNPGIEFSFDLKASKKKIGSYKFQDLIFFKATRDFYPPNGYLGPVKDVYDVDNNGNTQENVGRMNTAKLEIEKDKSLTIDSYIKEKGGERLPEYDVSDPITAIGFTPEVEADYTVEVVNNRENKIEDFMVYLPVPKPGNNFGTDFQESAFSWEMALQDVAENMTIYNQEGEDITDIKKQNYVIEYAKDATNVDNYKNAQYGGSREGATMIRISNKAGIDIGETTIITFPYIVAENNESLEKNPERLGKINEFRPYYYFDAGISGFLHGTRVGAMLEIGEISGMLYHDVDIDGTYDQERDDLLENRVVRLFKENSASDYTLIGTNLTKADGTFHFVGLASGSYRVDFNSAKESVGEEFTLIKQGEDDRFDSDIPFVGENKGYVDGINPATEDAKNVTGGVIKYNHLTDLKVIPSSNKIEMLASNSQGNKTQPISASITPEYFDKIKSIENSIVWSSADTDIVTVSSGEIENTLTAGNTTGVDKTTTVNITLSDMYGYTTSEEVEVKVLSNDIPMIDGADMDIEAGTEINDVYLKSLVTVTDTEDGRLTPTFTNNITINEVGKAITLGEYFVEYDAIDSDGNTAKKKLKIEVIDTMGPEIITNVDAVTVEASEESIPTDWTTIFGAEALDIVDGNITESIEYMIDSGLTAMNIPGTYKIIANVQDKSGNKASEKELTYTIGDTTAPKITTNVESVTAEASEESIPTDWTTIFGAEALDSVDGNVTESIKYTIDSGLTAMNIPGTYKIIANVQDKSGNKASGKELTYTIGDTTAPKITTNIESVTVEASEESIPTDWTTIFGAEALDIVDGNVTESIEYTIDSGLTAMNIPGTYKIIANVQDKSGNKASGKELTYTVGDTTGPKIITNVESVTVEASEESIPTDWTTIFGAEALDIVDGNVTESIKYTIDSGLTAMNIPGTYKIIANVQDKSGNKASGKELTYTIGDTTAPKITTNIESVTVEASEESIPTDWTMIFGAIALDIVDGNVTESIEYTIDPRLTAMNIPGTYKIIANVQDKSGNRASEKELTYTIRDTTAPEITTKIGSVTVEASEESMPTDWTTIFGVEALDIVDGNVTESIEYTIDPRLTAMNIPGTYKIIANVQDKSGNKASGKELTYTIGDTTVPKITTNVESVTVEASEESIPTDWTTIFGAEALDIVDGNITESIEYSIDSGLTAMNIPGTYKIIANVQDKSGNKASEKELTYTIGDTTAPKITTNVESVTVEPSEESIPTDWTMIFGVEALDIVDGNVTESIEYTIDPELTAMNIPGIYKIIANVQDRLGNKASEKELTYTIGDATAPKITTNVESVTVEASEESIPTDWTTIFGVEAADNIDGDITESIEYTIDPELTAMNIPGIYKIIANVQDKSGNKASEKELTYTIGDTTAPKIATNVESVTVEASEESIPTDWTTIFGAEALDIVDGNVTESIEYTIDSRLTAMNIPGTYKIIANVQDKLGNKASGKELTYTVGDTTAPKITTNVESVTVEASEESIPTNWTTIFGVEALDIVDGNVTESIEYSIDSGLTAMNIPGTYKIIANVQDKSGNKASGKELTYTIRDTTGPKITTSVESVTVEASEERIPTDWTTIFGVEAVDIVDGNVTESIEYTIDFELTAMNIPGTYKIKANVTDAAGNRAVEKELVYIIEDTAKDTMIDKPIDDKENETKLVVTGENVVTILVTSASLLMLSIIYFIVFFFKKRRVLE